MTAWRRFLRGVNGTTDPVRPDRRRSYPAARLVSDARAALRRKYGKYLPRQRANQRRPGAAAVRRGPTQPDAMYMRHLVSRVVSTAVGAGWRRFLLGNQ